MDTLIKKAIQAIKVGDHQTAKKLLASILKEDPQNEHAWLYLTLCVTDPQQKQECLHRVLSINPNNQHALRAQARLSNRSNRPLAALPAKSRSSLFNIVDILVDSLFKVPTEFYLVIVFFLLIVGAFTYTRLNTDFFGLMSPDFAAMTVMDQYETIQDEQGASWKITYEGHRNTIFEGHVRHVSFYRINKFPFLTHDILITSGDYADPDLVYTNVSNHHFYWQSLSSDQPQGSINLLHVVPETEDIYQQLLKIRNGDMVTITGKEVLRIDAYDSLGKSQGWWKDTGCNTILVKEVSVED